ncbi:hypothetical protein CsSME_00004327 [Camellia sinensis var. sinensis]
MRKRNEPMLHLEFERRKCKDRRLPLSRKGQRSRVGFRRQRWQRRVCFSKRLHNLNVPQNLLLSPHPVRNVVSHGVPPRRKTAVGAEEVAATRLESHRETVSNRFPFDGGTIMFFGNCLEDLATARAGKEWDIRGGEVFSVTALES